METDIKIYEWLQSSEHATPPDGKIFLLTTEQEIEEAGMQQLLENSNIEYWDQETGYIVMTYEKYDEMAAAFEKCVDNE